MQHAPTGPRPQRGRSFARPDRTSIGGRVPSLRRRVGHAILAAPMRWRPGVICGAITGSVIVACISIPKFSGTIDAGVDAGSDAGVDLLRYSVTFGNGSNDGHYPKQVTIGDHDMI